MRWNVASLALYVLTRRPALFEEATPLTLAAKLLAVLDVVRPLYPLVFVPARRAQIVFALSHSPACPFSRFGSLASGAAVAHARRAAANQPPAFLCDDL